MMKFLMGVGLAGMIVGQLGWAEIQITDGPPVKPAKPAATVVTAVANPVASGVDGDILKFRNGDVLHGTVLGATAAGGLRWRRSDVKEPILFNLESVGELTLAPRGKSTGGQRAIAELTNGDALAGELTSLNGETVTLQTWYAGAVKLQRAMVQRLVFVSELPDAAYTGPTSLEEWKSEGSRKAWSFKKGALYSVGSGTIGRDVRLPEVANIEFDLAWRGQLYCSVGFGFEDVRQLYKSGGYMVQMSYSSIYLQRYRPNQGNNNMGNPIEMQELQRKSKMRVSVRVNKPKKMLALFLDGNLVRQWTETEEWAGKGTGLVFVAHGQGQARITDITVTSWDGRLESETGLAPKEADLVRLNNGDKVSGAVKSIANGQVALAASFAEMNVPVERVVAVEFASAKSARARRQAADVQAVFEDGRRLTLALEKLEEGSLTGASEAWGRLSVALGALRRVQFHIYEKRDDGAEGDEWDAAGGAGAGDFEE
ncbi:MAG: hypothetical protein PCFJNLEI_02473 [Verrucomicrobiae bacterium]|nr:hypothetical protein [Verrucomicrobiae bacterium]